MAFLLRNTRSLINVARQLPRAVQTRHPQRQLQITARLLQSKEPEDKEEMDDLKKNPYFDKYADKIAKLQQTSPEEFLERLGKAEEDKKRKSELERKGGNDGKEFSFPSGPKKDVKGGSVAQSQEKKLNDVMKLELLQDKTKDEIAEIWREYHSKRDSVAAVIPADMFAQMQNRFEEFKTFLFPVPRKEGYEFVVVQFEGKEAHFTTLINFQAYKENAPECLTLVHYTDLAESKGIVLMVGEYDTKVLTIQEAQCLANHVELYYCNPSEEKLKLMDTFTNRPMEFKHQALIDQVNNLSLS